MNRSTYDRVALFHEQSFFVIPRLLDGPPRLELRRACDAALEAARASWQETGHTTPRISLLGEADPGGRVDRRALEAVARFAGSPDICGLLAGLGGLAEDGDVPRLKDAHYYHEQTKRDWDGDWHRDSQFGRPDPEAERAAIATTTVVHVRVALEDDDCLEIVPGSHRRWDTPDELRVRLGAERAMARMPNAERITLRAGDGCVFHAWSIHRASYRRAPVRRTLDALYAFTRPQRRSWAILRLPARRAGRRGAEAAWPLR